MQINDVIQFNENHKWCGCFGYIREVKKCNEDTRYMVAVQSPKKGTTFIYVMDNENALDLIGKTNLVLKDEK